MSLTRKFLAGMGLTEDQVGAIIEEHTSVTGALKDQISALKNEKSEAEEQAKRIPELEKKIKDLEEKDGNNDWEKKYNEEHTAFEEYKKQIDGKEKLEKIKTAYRELLKECSVGERHIDSILRVTDFENIKLDKEGKLSDTDSLKETIQKDWSGFISVKDAQGEKPENPPGGSGGTNTGSRAKILAAKYHDNLYGSVKKEG